MRVSSAEKVLLDIRNSLNTILAMAAHKKKTVKWKACKRTCTLLLNRANASIDIIQNGGSGEDAAVTGDEIIIRMSYSDIIEYWQSELNK